jgi:hypothetical protein
MYLIAIGYAYVILLVALASGSLLSGLSVALFLGILPLWAFIRLTSRASRRRSATMSIHPAPGKEAGHPDGEHAKSDK